MSNHLKMWNDFLVSDMQIIGFILACLLVLLSFGQQALAQSADTALTDTTVTEAKEVVFRVRKGAEPEWVLGPGPSTNQKGDSLSPEAMTRRKGFWYYAYPPNWFRGQQSEP